MIISFVKESDGQRKSSYCLKFYSLVLIWSSMITIISRMSFVTLDVLYDGTCICRYISQSRVFDILFTFKDRGPLVLDIWYFTKSDLTYHRWWNRIYQMDSGQRFFLENIPHCWHFYFITRHRYIGHCANKKSQMFLLLKIFFDNLFLEDCAQLTIATSPKVFGRIIFFHPAIRFGYIVITIILINKASEQLTCLCITFPFLWF